MANKAISELPQAQNVNNQDLFVLEQSGIAKKLTAETFITEQGIIDALAEALDGHGGIQSVTLASVSGRIRTYRITFSDGSATTFQVYDGTTIERISRTSSSGLQDTYTIFMSDGTTTFFTVTNGADGTVSEAMLNDALKDKAPAITETTESSAIANFTDGADDLVMHHVVAEINPVQSGSGDPSPSNIRPITGWTGVNVKRCGKNLVPQFRTAQTTSYGLTVTPLANGGIRVHGTSTATSATLLSMVNVSIPIKAGTYTFGIGITDSANKVYCQTVYSGSNFYSKVAPQTKTLTNDITITRLDIGVSASNGENIDVTVFPQLEVGSTATAYEPYTTPTTVSLSWQTEAGTVYGGTIDVATGLLTVDRAMVTYNSSSGFAEHASGRWYHNGLPSGADTSKSGEAISNQATYRNSNDNYPYFSFGGSGVYINKITADETMEQFSARLQANPMQICYFLATPQTYLLTPQQLMTLLGTNNVWADTGDVSVTYPADTKMYIQNLTQPTEDDLVANQAITSGKYFMVGNSLYLALANIASGAQITIGTNAQRVSLADALNTINS